MTFAPMTFTCRLGFSRPAVTTFLCLVVGTFVGQLKAQTCGANAQSTISTDRPQVTNSSVVVPCGSFQIENGMQVSASGGQHGTDFSETSVRVGIAVRTELRVSAPNYFYDDPVASDANGFGDLSVGVKQQLGPFRGFAISLIPSISLPTGAKVISSHGYDPTVQVPWSRALTNAWTLAGQLGVTWPTESGQRNASGQASLYVDRQVTAPMDAYVEYSGAFPQRGGPQHLIDFGMAYKPTPYQQIDVHCGFGRSPVSPQYVVGFGYSVRFQMFRRK